MRGIVKRPSLRFRVACVCLALAIVAVCADMALRPALRRLAANRAALYATETVARVMDGLMTGEPALFADVVALVSGADGSVRSISVDTASANRLRTAAARAVAAAFTEPETARLSLPLGTLSGWQLLADMGPAVEVGVRLSGAPLLDFEGDFAAAGVNQTVHRLRLAITVEVEALLPFETVHVPVTASYLVAETVVVGEVPYMLPSGE